VVLHAHVARQSVYDDRRLEVVGYEPLVCGQGRPTFGAGADAATSSVVLGTYLEAVPRADEAGRELR
jgi:hypothetical protein